MRTTVTLDGEWLLAQIQQIEYILDEIRSVATEGVSTTTVIDSINLDEINWLKKGSEPAYPEDGWAWAFAYDNEGDILPETDALVKAIKRDGKVRVNGYEITISGRENNLLSRKKVKTKGRGQ